LITPEGQKTVAGSEALRESAINLGADLVICKDESDLDEFADLMDRGIEVCTLRGYTNSEIEKKRKKWTTSKRLDTLDAECAKDIVGSAIKYEKEVFILDYTIGLTAGAASNNANTDDADRFMSYLHADARGVMYFVEQWCAYSPYAGELKLKVNVVTAGRRVNTNDYCAPATMTTWIQQAIFDVDASERIGDLRISIKLKSREFLDRFMFSGRRCWGLRHGIDAFGKLGDDPRRRVPAHIDPHSEDNADLVRQILRLPNAV
jgi:hypothetical protein